MNGSIASHVARGIGRFVTAQPGRVSYSGGAVSFSFDDFPRSALEAGGAILERHDVRGTYYVALGLAGSDGNQGPIADRGEILEAHQRGHEIACHTYSHLDCSRATVALIRDELRRNADGLAELLDGFPLRNFAYPYGRYLLPVKRLVAPLFASSRGTCGGSNQGDVDFADLRGTRIYAPQYNEAALKRLIDRNAEIGGWLIFYTHDVGDAPSAYGCTPGQLEAVVAHAVTRSAVLPVDEVIGSLEARHAA